MTLQRTVTMKWVRGSRVWISQKSLSFMPLKSRQDRRNQKLSRNWLTRSNSIKSFYYCIYSVRVTFYGNYEKNSPTTLRRQTIVTGSAMRVTNETTWINGSRQVNDLVNCWLSGKNRKSRWPCWRRSSPCGRKYRVFGRLNPPLGARGSSWVIRA